MTTNIYDAQIQFSAEQHGVPWTLLKAIIEHESDFNPNAIGDGGAALGLMQMHAPAAKEVGAVWSQLTIPAVAIDAGCEYFAKMLNKCDGDETMALASYNQGYWAMHDPNGHEVEKQRGMAYAAAVQKIEDSYNGAGHA